MPRFSSARYRASPEEVVLPRETWWSRTKEYLQDYKVLDWASRLWMRGPYRLYFNLFQQTIHPVNFNEETIYPARYREVPTKVLGIPLGTKRQAPFLALGTRPGNDEEISLVRGIMNKIKESRMDLSDKKHENLKEFLSTYLHNFAVMKLKEKKEELARQLGEPDNRYDYEAAEKFLENTGTDYETETVDELKKTFGEHASDFQIGKALDKPGLKLSKAIGQALKWGRDFYSLEIGEGGITRIYKAYTPGERGNLKEASVGKPREPGISRFKNWLLNLQEWHASRKYAQPDPELWQFHPNLGENHLDYGQTWVGNVKLTVNNIKKKGTDQKIKSWLEQIILEALRKRETLGGFQQITGRALAKALAQYSHDFGELDDAENKIGYYQNQESVDINKLGLPEFFAVEKLTVARGLVGANFKLFQKLEPSTMGLYEKEYSLLKSLQDQGKKIDTVRLNLLEESFRKGKDYIGLVERASFKPDGNSVPWASLVVLPGGVLDLAEEKIDKNGRVKINIAPGARPYKHHRSNIPTYSAEGHVVFRNYLRSDVFWNKLVEKMKDENLPVPAYLMKHRQDLKNIMANSLHGGSADDGMDMAMKLATVMGMDSSMGDHFYLTIHEQEKQFTAGGEKDSLRRTISSFVNTFEDVVRLFYWGYGINTEREPGTRPAAFDERTRFLNQIIQNAEVQDPMMEGWQHRQNAWMHTNEAATAPLEKKKELLEMAESERRLARKQKARLAKVLFDVYRNDVAPATHFDEPGFGKINKEKEEIEQKRIRKIAGWLMGQSRIFKTFFPEFSVPTAAGPSAAPVLGDWGTDITKQQTQRLANVGKPGSA